jgi:YVTN family beta-propeller protein
VTYYQNNVVTVIDTLTNSVASNRAVPAALGIAFDPAGTIAYVASSLIPGQLYLIDTATFNMITTIPLGSQPVDVAVSPDGALVLVNNFGGGTTVIDRASSQVIGTVPTAAGTRGISFVP